MVAFLRPNAPYSYRIPALVAQLFLMKAQAHPIRGYKHNFVIPISQDRVDQGVIRLDLNRNDSAFAHVTIIGKVRLLDDARAGGENDVQVFIPGLIDYIRASAAGLGLDTNGRGNFFPGP